MLAEAGSNTRADYTPFRSAVFSKDDAQLSYSVKILADLGPSGSTDMPRDLHSRSGNLLILRYLQINQIQV